MGQRRRNHRFQFAEAVRGTFSNMEKFLLKDINFEGLHLVSNFSPIIGSKYMLTVKDKRQSENFDIEVVRVNEDGFNADEGTGMPIGVVYSVGARWLNITQPRKKFLMNLMTERT